MSVELVARELPGPAERTLLVVHGGPDWDHSYLVEPLRRRPGSGGCCCRTCAAAGARRAGGLAGGGQCLSRLAGSGMR